MARLAGQHQRICGDVLALVSATVGKIAHEIIDLQKLEFGEVEEPYEAGKIGSSTMPQKRNPMLCEAILALARLVRTRAATAVDAMIHEHERDWSSMQMEWAYLPEVCIMTHGAMTMTLRVLRGLHVYPDAMARNLDVTGGTLLAERVMLELGQGDWAAEGARRGSRGGDAGIRAARAVRGRAEARPAGERTPE